MKQHITTDQLNQLTEDNYNKLVKYIYEEENELFSELSEEDVDLTTMLAYLNNSKDVEGFHLFHLKRDSGQEWGLEIKTIDTTNSYRDQELVDVLWSALKDIL